MSSKRQQHHKSKALQFMTFELQDLVAQRSAIRNPSLSCISALNIK